MGHTCPECGHYCTCRGDWDDIDFGDDPDCECNCAEDDDEYDEYDPREDEAPE